MQVVLIGEAFDGSENLALSMLTAALLEAGHRVECVALNSVDGVEAAAEEALEAIPELVGISMNYQVSALSMIAVAHYLRRAGFRGHITAGGAFATLHSEEVMRDSPVDSLIQYEAERGLAMLADRLEQGRLLDDVPSLVRRSGPDLVRSAASREWNDAYPVWAHRPERAPEHLGVPSATMVGSRGCNYRCSFCSIAALGAQTKRDAPASGFRERVSGVRRRSVDDLADEIAALSGRGVRLFRFEDDNLLGNSPAETVSYARDLRDALDERRVGRIGFTLKIRPDSLDSVAVEALVSLGLIHGFVGLEALTDATLKRLNRAYRARTCFDALSALRAHGVPAYFNALAIGPDATVATLCADLEALEGVDDFPFELVVIALYGHTALHRRLSERGAVRGNYLSWQYDFADPAIARLVSMLSRLPTRRTGAYCVAKQVADLDFNIAIARRFHPGSPLERVEQRARELRRAANVASRSVIWQLLDLALAASEPQRERRFERLASSVQGEDRRLSRRCGELVSELERLIASEGSRSGRAFLRGGLAAATVATQLALAPAAVASDQPIIIKDAASMDTEVARVAQEVCNVNTDACEVLRITVHVDEEGIVTRIESSGSLSESVNACIAEALAKSRFILPEGNPDHFEVHLYGPCD